MLSSLASAVANADSDIWWFIIIICGVLSVGGFFMYRSGLHRKRLIENIPRSWIRSAAQGYVELHGAAWILPGEPITARLTAQPCVWYKFEVEEKRRDSDGDTKWVTVENGTSTDLFQLRDDTGDCIIDPEGADVISVIEDKWHGDTRWPSSGPAREKSFWQRSGKYRYTEKRLHERDILYIIGNFRTQSLQANADTSLGDLLRKWKEDKTALLERFDADQDGSIDATEWEAARAAAEQQIVQERLAHAAAPPVTLVSKPKEPDRPYIISARDEAELLKSYHSQVGIGIALFLGCGAAFVWMLGIRLAAG